MSDNNKLVFHDDNLNMFYQQFLEHIEKEKEDRAEIVLGLKANTDAIVAMSESTKELLDAWKNAQGFLKVIAAVSKMFKVLAPIAVAIVAIVHLFKTGQIGTGK